MLQCGAQHDRTLDVIALDIAISLQIACIFTIMRLFQLVAILGLVNAVSALYSAQVLLCSMAVLCFLHPREVVRVYRCANRVDDEHMVYALAEAQQNLCARLVLRAPIGLQHRIHRKHSYVFHTLRYTLSCSNLSQHNGTRGMAKEWPTTLTQACTPSSKWLKATSLNKSQSHTRSDEIKG